MHEDPRLQDRPLRPMCCGLCGATVAVRKASWDQTSIQWSAEASAACLERRACHDEPFTGCTQLRKVIREAAVRGTIVVPLD